MQVDLEDGKWQPLAVDLDQRRELFYNTVDGVYMNFGEQQAAIIDEDEARRLFPRAGSWLYEEQADQLAAWGSTLGFDIRMTADKYIVRLSNTDTNFALWQTGDGFVFGTGFRNDSPRADVSSASFEVVFRYATWHLVNSQADLLPTIDRSSAESAPGFTLEPGPESGPPGILLRSPAGWSAFFTTASPGLVAATFSHVASLTAEEIRDLA